MFINERRYLPAFIFNENFSFLAKIKNGFRRLPIPFNPNREPFIIFDD